MNFLDNLISYFKLDGNSNDEVASNDGTDTDITYSAGNGKIVQGAGFNGSTSSILISNSSGQFDKTIFSISMWVKPTWTLSSVGYNPTLIALRNTDGTRFSLHITEGYSQLDFYNGSDGDNWITNVSKDNWHHVVMVYDSGTVSLYFDNSYLGDNIISVGANTLKNLAIGNNGIPAERWIGAIDEVGIWDRALDSTEVAQLYNGGAGLAYPSLLNNSNFFHFI